MMLYDKNGHNNWVTSVRHFLFSKGFGYVWNDQYVDLEDVFIVQLTKRLEDMYLQECFAKMSLSNKCLFYRMFKCNLDPEMYLSCVNVKKFRIALSRFRCSSHDLFIESGRYKNVSREKRICKLCNLRQVEDEYHFLLICPIYSSIRNLYIKKYYFVYPNQYKFAALMNNRNHNVLQNLSMFIYYAMKYRLEQMTELNI